MVAWALLTSEEKEPREGYCLPMASLVTSVKAHWAPTVWQALGITRSLQCKLTVYSMSSVLASFSAKVKYLSHLQTLYIVREPLRTFLSSYLQLEMTLLPRRHLAASGVGCGKEPH